MRILQPGPEKHYSYKEKKKKESVAMVRHERSMTHEKQAEIGRVIAVLAFIDNQQLINCLLCFCD